MGVACGTMRQVLMIAVVACFSAAAVARGAVTTERGSSILVFPKVIADPNAILPGGQSLQTVIQLSNTSNNLVFLHCFYVNAAPLDPTRPADATNPAQWQEIDFDITLTKQQPTHWLVGEGRLQDPKDPLCNRTVRDCSGAGFDPGKVPPVDDPFEGELKCVEVDSGGQPLNGNHLKGEATLVSPQGEVSKYNAIGIQGLNTDTNSNDQDPALCLGGQPSAQCPSGAEYEACPDSLIFSHFAEDATDPVIEELGNGPSVVGTELTLVPCSEDFENVVPESVTVQFRIWNEFEEVFSTSTTVTCWGNFRLRDVDPIFLTSRLGTRFAQTRATAVAGQSGILGVLEEFHTQPAAATSRIALDVHGEGERARGDVILVPGEQLQ